MIHHLAQVGMPPTGDPPPPPPDLWPLLALAAIAVLLWALLARDRRCPDCRADDEVDVDERV